MTDLLELLETLSEKENDMPWELLIPIFLKMLESLVKKERESAKAGVDGPLSSWFATSAWFATYTKGVDIAGDQDAFKAAIAAYLRCCDLPK